MDPDDATTLHPTPAQLRTLAHPLRSRLLGALRIHGPATATELAARLGTNSGATSYHLRKLAAGGLVADDPDRSTGRDRAWRSMHDRTVWRAGDYADDPDAREAEDWLLRHCARATAERLDGWLDVRSAWPDEWRDAADQSDYHLELTPDGLRALMDELHAVVRRHLERAESAPLPADARGVTLLLQGFPSPDGPP